MRLPSDESLHAAAGAGSQHEGLGQPEAVDGAQSASSIAQARGDANDMHDSVNHISQSGKRRHGGEQAQVQAEWVVGHGGSGLGTADEGSGPRSSVVGTLDVDVSVDCDGKGERVDEGAGYTFTPAPGRGGHSRAADSNDDGDGNSEGADAFSSNGSGGIARSPRGKGRRVLAKKKIAPRRYPVRENGSELGGKGTRPSGPRMRFNIVP
jgi:hypothetical protein